MPSDRQPVLIASRNVFDRLQASGMTPPDFAARLHRGELLDYVRSETDQEGSHPAAAARFIAINRGLLRPSAEGRDGIEERFLSMLAGRMVVSVDVLAGGEGWADVDKAIARHGRLVAALAACGQRDQSARTQWVLILVVPDVADGEGFKQLDKLVRRPGGPLVYLMDGKLRSSQTGHSVEARHVWPQAIPGLLMALAASPPQSHTGAVKAWRAVVVEPAMAPDAVICNFNRWLRNHVMGEPDAFRPPQFSPTPLSKGFEDALAWSPGRFSDAYQPSRFQRAVTTALSPKGAGTHRDERATILRAEAAKLGQEADGDVRTHELQSWGQAQMSPSLPMGMAKALGRAQRDVFAGRDEGAGRWAKFLAKLTAAEAARQHAADGATVLDAARAHFVSWWLRVSIAAATMLLVIYIVFVTLYPLLDAAFSSWWFWIPCMAGMCGAAVATSLSWTLERNAGAHGERTLTKSVKRAHLSSATRACIEFMAGVHEGNQTLAYGQMLGHTATLAKRLELTIEYATRDADVRGTSRTGTESELARLDRETFERGTVLRIGSLDAERAEAFAAATLEAEGESLWRNLMLGWSRMAAACDEESRGSFPVQVVGKEWARALERAWAEFRRCFVDRVTADWRDGEFQGAGVKLGQAMAGLRGFSPSERPFLSSRHVADRSELDGDVRLLIARDERLGTAAKEQLRRGGPPLMTHVVRDLPVLAVYLEIVPVCWNEEAGKG